VTLSVSEPCQNVSNQEFQWDRPDDPIPGWDLTEGWKTNEGIPVRGILRLRFTSYGSSDNHDGKKVYKIDRDLRRILTYATLTDEIDMRCEGAVSKPKNPNLIESAKSRKQLWNFIYPL
jgi:hypothetical protein